jgi:predicted enzyme related to lactoylglutathione lyase
VRSRRRRLQAVRVRPLACCSEVGRRTGGHGQAANEAETVLQLDPYREIAYQQLTLAQAASGNRASALPCERCRRLLGGELSTTSSPALQALHLALLRARRRRCRPAAPPDSTPRGIRPTAEVDAWCRLANPDRTLSPPTPTLGMAAHRHREVQVAAPVVWFEIAGRDLEALMRFYGDLLGWKVDADNPQRYGMVDTGAEGGIPGGIYAPGPQVGEYVSFYAGVQGLEGYLERAERLGGKVVQPPTPISETARVAMLLDPEGHRIGLLEQA